MRILLLTLIVFVLAGFSIGLSQYDMSELTPSFLAEEEPELVFEANASVEKDDGRVRVTRSRPDGVMLLTRSAGTQTARYTLPQDAGLVSGILELNAAVQISDNQHSLLRVSVGNQTRGEVVLRSGHHDVAAEIELTADDLATENLAIRYTLVTTDEPGACTTAGTFPSVVEIEQNSRIALEVENGKLTPRDQVAVDGNEVLIGWPAWLSEEQRQERWTSAMQLALRGFNVRLVDAPDSATLSGNPLRELVGSDLMPISLQEEAPAWPEEFAKVGNNAGKRTFQGSASWRHWYRVGPHDHQSAPGALVYELMLGPLPNGAEWTVTATHNGSIIDAQQVPGNVGLVQGNLSLAGLEIEQSNLVEITAISGYQPTGLCNNGPELFAELRPTTQLLGGGELFQNDIDPLRAQLNQREPLTVALPADMSLVEAQRMLDLMIELAPENAELRVVAENAMVTGVLRGDFAQVAYDAPPNGALVWFDDTDLIHAQSTATLGEDEDAPVPSGALALLVNPGDQVRSSYFAAP